MTLTALLAGCGPKGNPDPTAAVPADAATYIEFDTTPSAAQAEVLKRIGQRLPGEGPAMDRLVRAIGEELSRGGLDVSVPNDIAPWADERVGLFISSFSHAGHIDEAAFVFSTKDSERAAEAIGDTLGKGAERITHGGVEYRVRVRLAGALVDDLAVVGTPSAVEAAIDASKKGSMARSASYKRRRDRLPKDWLVASFSTSRPNSALQPPDVPRRSDLTSVLARSTVSTLRPDRGGLLVETELPVTLGRSSFLAYGDRGTKLLGELPADSWIAIGQTDVGAKLRRLLRTKAVRDAAPGIGRLFRARVGIDLDRDLLSPIADAAVFANGLPGDPSSAGALLETKQPGVSRRALDRLARAIRVGVRPIAGELNVGRGYRLDTPDLPWPLEVMSDRRRVAIALKTGLAATVILPSTPLRDRAEFKEMVGRLPEGSTPSLYINMEGALGMLESAGYDALLGRAKPVVQAIDRVVAGTLPPTDGRLTAHIAITLK